jgi:glycosyltransferase involved in cell wall biosynthesis
MVTRRQSGPVLRVLIAVPDLTSGGGIANYFATARANFGAEVTFITRGSGGVRAGPAARLVRILRDYLHFARQLVRVRPDLVHQNTSFGRVGLLRDGVTLVIARLLRRPVLVFFHGWDRALAQALSGVGLWLLGRVYFSADAIIVHAAEMSEQLKRWGYPGRVFVETQLVDERLIDQAGAASPGGGEPFRILFLARVERDKGVLETVRAVDILHRRGHRVHLVVAGRGSALAEARALAATLGCADQIRFVGHVEGDDKRRLFAEAHAYVLPTAHQEGMPHSLMEAIASGLPVVTRPIGGIRDLFQQGQMGWMTESRDPGDLADLIERLIRDEPVRQAMGAFNRRLARERLASPAVVARLEAIYRWIVNGDAGSR